MFVFAFNYDSLSIIHFRQQGKEVFIKEAANFKVCNTEVETSLTERNHYKLVIVPGFLMYQPLILEEEKMGHPFRIILQRVKSGEIT